MNRGVFDDSDWTIEARKKVIRGLPQNVYDTLYKLVEFSTKPGMKEPPGLQASIDQQLLQFSPDRKKANALMHFKVMNLLAATFSTDLKTDLAQKTCFSCLFLGRVSDNTLHKVRITLLSSFASLALHYPMSYFFNMVAEWLLTKDNYIHWAPLLMEEICNGFLFQPINWHMEKFVEPLVSEAFMFCALFAFHLLQEDLLAELHHNSVLELLGTWFAKNSKKFLEFYSHYLPLAQEFSTKRYPLMLEYDLSNGKFDDVHEKFHVGVCKLLVNSPFYLTKAPLDLTKLQTSQCSNNEVTEERREELFFLARESKILT